MYLNQGKVVSVYHTNKITIQRFQFYLNQYADNSTILQDFNVLASIA